MNLLKRRGTQRLHNTSRQHRTNAFASRFQVLRYGLGATWQGWGRGICAKLSTVLRILDRLTAQRQGVADRCGSQCALDGPKLAVGGIAHRRDGKAL